MRRFGLTLVVLASCHAFRPAGPMIQGSGRPARQARSPGPFRSVVLRGTAHLRIEQTGIDSVSVTADDNLLPYLGAEVDGDRLVLGATGINDLVPTRPVTYHVTIAALRGIEARGAGEVRAAGLDGNQLEVALSGSARVALEGRVDHLAARVSGAGRLDAGALSCRSARVQVSDSAAALVDPSDRLEADASGSATVEYLGEPEVSRRTSGSARVERRSAP